MKKAFLSLGCLLAAAMVSAQLPYDTKLTQQMFNDAQTVYSKSENCSWVALTGRIQLGSVLNFFSAAEDNVVIALPQLGLSRKIYFSHAHAGSGTMKVETSTDHNNWTGIWSLTEDGSVTSGLDTINETIDMPATARFIRLVWNGTMTASFGNIQVSERKDLSVSSDECTFTNAKVDDPIQTKTVKVYWTSIVTSVTSSNPAFTISTNTIGEKNKENQTTELAISYNHNEAGNHQGQITIEGEGLSAVINVTGQTTKYDQQLSWTETLGNYYTSDNITLHAFSNQGLPITYLSSDSTVAWVNEYGQVVCVCAGQVTLSAFQPGDYKFNGTDTVAKQLTLLRVDPIIAVSAADLTYGQKAFECVLTETNQRVAGTLQWLDIAPDSLPDAGLYAWDVLFTPDNLCLYNTAVRRVALCVNKAPQTIAWAQDITEVREGETLTLDASVSSGLPVAFAMTNCIADIDNGILTGNEEGQTTVIAFQPGDNNYLPTAVVMHLITVTPGAQPTPTRNDEVSPDEVIANGTKYVKNGFLYWSYMGRTYDAQGRPIK